MDVELATGKKFFQLDTTLAAVLIELGLARPIRVAPPAAPAGPKWSISVGISSGVKNIQFSCTHCHRNAYFSGVPAQLADWLKSLCVHAGDVPGDVLTAYGEGGVESLPRVSIGQGQKLSLDRNHNTGSGKVF